jgi:tellurite resistance protein TehA-like permease
MPGIPWALVAQTQWDLIALFAGLWMLLALILGLVVGVRLRGLTSLAPAVDRHDEQVG